GVGRPACLLYSCPLPSPSLPIIARPPPSPESRRRPPPQPTPSRRASKGEPLLGSSKIEMDGGEHEAEESSSQRRERLLALRSAASAPPAGAPAPAPAGSLLPDLDLAGDHASVQDPRPPQRFGYYTNPAAAYSGGATNPTWSHKRKSPPQSYNPRPAPPPPAYGNYGDYYPPHQHHLAPSPIHSPPLIPRDVRGSSPWRSPMQFQDPMSGYQGAPPGAPPPWGPHSGPPARGSYPNSPRFGFRHPNPVQGGSPMNYGPRGSPNSSYGRGRGAN
ncbi:unnamed protein product, partial [Urochloa humidicola]